MHGEGAADPAPCGKTRERTTYALHAHLEATIVPGRHLERNPHLQERLQCRWDGWLVPSQASWRTARHGLPLRSCGLRGPLP